MNDVAEPSVTCAQARERFDDLLERAVKRKDRVVPTRRGKPVAALVPIEDLNFLETIEDQLDVEEFQRVKEEFARSGEPTFPSSRASGRLGSRFDCSGRPACEPHRGHGRDLTWRRSRQRL